MKKTIGVILTLPLILMLLGCPPMGDCMHNFVYQGRISASDSLLNDSLIIRFDNMGDIIFNIQNRRFSETSIIDNKGHYKVNGDFFTACGSDENIFDEKDSLSYEIIRNGHVTSTGKFCIQKLDRQYNDNEYFTTITLPAIQTE